MLISSKRGGAVHCEAGRHHALSHDLDDPVQRRVLSEEELAQRWGVNRKTLSRWRQEGRGPKYMKVAKRVCYPVEAIVEFERHTTYSSTSERAMA